jgi:hypothetical protein
MFTRALNIFRLIPSSKNLRLGVQAFKRSSVQAFKRSSVQAFKRSSVQAFKRSSVQAFINMEPENQRHFNGSLYI